MADKPFFYALGKRKTARATVKLYPAGSGSFTVNDATLSEWACDPEMKAKSLAPLNVLGIAKDYDVVVRTSGGGLKAQSEAIRLGVARAILKKHPEYKPQLKEEGYLMRDSRVKERKKPGLKRARRAPQFSKR